MSSINSPPEKNADKKQKDRCPLVSLSCFSLAVRLVKKKKEKKKGCYSEGPLFDSAPGFSFSSKGCGLCMVTVFVTLSLAADKTLKSPPMLTQESF